MPTQETAPQKDNTKVPTNPLKGAKRKFPLFQFSIISLVTILILLVSSIAVFFFLSSRECERGKRNCQEELALAQIEQFGSENMEDDSDTEDEQNEEDECADCPECVCPVSEEEDCKVSFTAEERLMMEGWIKYTNNTNHYSFMHPSSWMIMDTYPNSLEAGESLHFEFFVLTGETLNDDILPDYPFTVEDGYVKEFYCTKAYQLRVSQPPPNEWEGVATYLIYKGNPYLTWVRFADEGASVTSDTIELYNLILKTFVFE